MKNATESAVRSVYASILKKQKDFCTCTRCQDDVVALALNNTKPHYVSGSPGLGEVVTGVHLSLDQMRAELTVVIFDAMRRVAANPRHDAP